MAAVIHIGFSGEPGNDIFNIELTQRRLPVHFLAYNMPCQSAAKAVTINQSIIDSHLRNGQMTLLVHQERSPSPNEHILLLKP